MPGATAGTRFRRPQFGQVMISRGATGAVMGSGGVLVGRILVADSKLAVGVSDADYGPVEDVAGEQGAADPGLDLAADEPAQRPRPVDRVVALLGDKAPGVGGDLKLHLPLAQPGPEVIEHEVDDVLDLPLGE